MTTNDEMKRDLGTLGSIGDRARTADQAKRMQDTVGQGLCPFCPPQTEGWRYPKIWKIGPWTLKINDFPYAHHDFHFVIVYETHTNEIGAVTQEEWALFGELLRFTVDEYNIQGGAVVMRFGHSDYNASTVRHLHGHIQVPAREQVQLHAPSVKLHETCNCPICLLVKDKKIVPIFESKHWFAAQATDPLPHHREHLLLAYQGHSTDIRNLRDEVWNHFGFMIKPITSIMRGGGIVLRFGDGRFHGGHPGHIYWEVMEPDLSGPSRAIFLTDQDTRKPLCKGTFAKDRSPEEVARREERMKNFGITS